MLVVIDGVVVLLVLIVGVVIVLGCVVVVLLVSPIKICVYVLRLIRQSANLYNTFSMLKRIRVVLQLLHKYSEKTIIFVFF